MLEIINNAANWALDLVIPLGKHNPLLLLVVAGFLIANVMFYFATKGREFMIMGYSALLFLVPFVRFA